MKYLFPACLVLVLAGMTPAAPPALQDICLDTDRTVESTSNEAMLRDLLTDDMTPQQKNLMLWRYFIQRNRHKERAPMVDPGNAAELMTKYGYGLCGNWAHHHGKLAASAGMTASRYGLKGHWVTAVKYWGEWHALDSDMLAVYIRPDGIIASAPEIRYSKADDGSYLLREGPPIKSFPWYMAADSISGTAGLYARSDLQKPFPKNNQWKWTYDLSLRPGQEIVLSWYGDPEVGFVSVTHLPNVRTKVKYDSLRDYLAGDFDYYRQEHGKAKWHWGYRRGGLPGNPLASWNGINGNGRVVYDLLRDDGKWALQMAASAENLRVENGQLALQDTAKPGQIVLDFDIPYVYGDAWIDKPLPEGAVVEFSRDGKAWRQVYPEGGVDDGERIRLFDLVRGVDDFQLRLTLPAGSKPLSALRAVGAFHHNFMVLPALLKGENIVQLRLADPDALAKNPLHVTYVYDQVDDDDGAIMRHEKVLTFTPQEMAATVDTGTDHWPLMREIRMVCGGEAPKPAGPSEETGELDWSAAPWDWAYWGVNFWNDFERGDRHGWRGTLTSTHTPDGSDFALDNSLMSSDGTRQLKLIRYGSFLNRDSAFRCKLWVKGVASIRCYSRNQSDKVYYEKTFTDLPQGAWTEFSFRFNDLVHPEDSSKTVQNDWFLSNVYMVVTPAEGTARQDVEFLIDDIICYDGELKHDPFEDPLAPQKARAENPAWIAQPANKAHANE